jgi:probable phosphoglycerate mutase
VENYGLTDLGKQQSSAVAKIVKSLCADREKSLEDVVIISSDFKRCIETAQTVKESLGLHSDIREEKGLRERYFGEFELGSSSSYAKVYTTDGTDPTKPKNSVETVYSVYERTKSVVESLEKEFNGKILLLVTHGDPLQIMTCYFAGYQPEEHRLLPYPENASLRNLSDMAGGLVRRLRSCKNNHYYAVRHGQAVSNVKGILVCDLENGASGYGLTDLGREQAKKAGVELSTLVPADHQGYSPNEVIVITSPLLRTHETASIIHDHLNCKTPLISDVRLIERQFGKLNLTSDSNIKQYWRGDLKDLHSASDGIESVYPMTERIIELVESLDTEYSGKVFVLVSHGDPILKMRRIFSFQPLNKLPFRGELPNCTILPFRWVDES